jgi:formate hydrogenlyase transcriptional activator
MSKCAVVSRDGEKVVSQKSAEIIASHADFSLASAPEAYKSLFQTLFEEAPDATLVSDSRGNILFLNAQTEKLFGYAKRELHGRPLEVLMPDRFRRRHAAQRLHYASEPSRRPMGAGLELYGLRKDGIEFPVEISLSPLNTPAGTVFANAIRDVSDRRQMEYLLQSQLTFEKLMSQLSSTFVNPLTTDVNGKINDALKAIAESMDFDRTCLSRVDPSTGKLVVTCFWSRPGIPGVTFQVADEHFPWLVRRVLTIGPFSVSRPDELPEEASVDRNTMIRSREQSTLGIPLRIGGQSVGVISFATFRKRQEWPVEFVSRLQQVADIFSNVMARKKADDELQLAYSTIRKLNQRLEQENLYLRKEISLEHNHSNVVGQSKTIREILRLAEQVAATDSAVLIQGETGTGKELLASTIHDLSPRKVHPMVKINCAALPATLIESELFGREKGAYTGALSREVGRFELADKSTIFLDEIGDLPMELQVKFLRVLQEGEFQRLGSPKTYHVDVRVIAATNRDLAAAVAEGKFREDLYYRLSVFPIQIPPLRERREDIQELVWYILQDLGKRMGKDIHCIQSSTLKAFQSYAWPGNVRELRNIIERNLILNTGPVFRAKLPEAATGRSGVSSGIRIEEVEREHILRVLGTTAWRIRGQQGAAMLLGLKPTTLESRMKKLNIQRQN